MAYGDMGRLRRHPGYPLFYATATLTRFADEMFSVGVVLLVLDRTGSAALAGATVAAVTLPSLVTGPVLGAWLDRAGDRRRQAMILDQVLAATSLVAIVLLAGNAPDWTVPAVALVAGITWPLSFGGFTSLIPVIVPDKLLAQANALEATSFNVAIIAGPALAGTISAVVESRGLAADGGRADSGRDRPDRARRRDGRRAHRPSTLPMKTIVRAGLLHLVRTPVLRGVSASGALALGGLGLLTVAFPFLAAEELGADRSVAGYMWAAFASGSMIGALLLVRLQTRWRPERVMLGAIFGLGLVMLSWPLASSVPVALALIALGGLVDGPGLSAQFAARQRWTPSEMLGQIFTTAASMKVGAFAIGAAVAGPAVVALGAPGTIVLAASLQIAAVALGLLLGAAGEPASGAARACGRRSRPGRLDLQQDDRVHEQRDAERDRPAVQVALDERAAAERARAGAADAERTREPGVLARVQQHEEDQDDGDEHLQDGQERVHGR